MNLGEFECSGECLSAPEGRKRRPTGPGAASVVNPRAPSPRHPWRSARPTGAFRQLAAASFAARCLHADRGCEPGNAAHRLRGTLWPSRSRVSAKNPKRTPRRAGAFDHSTTLFSRSRGN